MRRRKKPSTNVLGVLESYLLATAVTKGLANASVPEFIGLTGKGVGGNAYGSDGSLNWTIPEVLKFGTEGPAYGNVAGSLPEVIRLNLKRNGAMMAGQLIGIPIAFRIGAKLLKKPRRQMNSIMRQMGINEVKV
jgi:hypothetical protein